MVITNTTFSNRISVLYGAHEQQRILINSMGYYNIITEC